MKQKRIVTIQDISCFGKCSITVALPVISAMGIECAIVPTAILSTHTGGFQNFTFRDLNDDIQKIADHWKTYDLKFDAIYTGYLGSVEQLKVVGHFFDMFRDGALVFVDPVMADNGKLYTGFTPEFAQGMARLCAKADIIVPNLTEAAFMLGEEFRPAGTYDCEYIHALSRRLAALGCKRVVVTGVSYSPDSQGAVAYDSETDSFCQYFRENIPVSYHGTGDTFSSALIGAITRGEDMLSALKTAVDYTVECIKATVDDPSHWYGVKFEEKISLLTSHTL